MDIIEAGFPIASPDDFEAVRAIAMDVGNAVDDDGYVPVICGLSRTREKVRRKLACYTGLGLGCVGEGWPCGNGLLACVALGEEVSVQVWKWRQQWVVDRSPEG